MSKATKHWKRGRGKLGILAPLIGSWKATASTPMGSVDCTRTFEPVLGGNCVRLTARWDFGKGIYEEIAMIGVNADGKVAFWSFTSDGKNSNGTVADVSDIHPEAIGFEAQMPAVSGAGSPEPGSWRVSRKLVRGPKSMWGVGPFE